MNHHPIGPVRLSLNLDRQVEAAFQELIHAPWGRELAAAIWQPALDIFELDDAYIIEADLPGVTPGQVRVSAQGRQVILSGSRDSVTTAVSQGGRSLQLERHQGHFSRTIEFEHEIEAHRIQLQFDHGTLHVRIPKRSRSSS